MSKKFYYNGDWFDEDFDGFETTFKPYQEPAKLDSELDADSELEIDPKLESVQESYIKYLESTKQKFEEDIATNLKDIAKKASEGDEDAHPKILKKMDSNIMKLKVAFYRFLEDIGIEQTRTRKRLFDTMFAIISPFLISILEEEGRWSSRYNVITQKIGTLTNVFNKDDNNNT